MHQILIVRKARPAAFLWCAVTSWLVLASTAAAQTQVYRCTEDGGKVSYQAQPCSSGQGASRISVPARSAPPIVTPTTSPFAPAPAAAPAPELAPQERPNRQPVTSGPALGPVLMPAQRRAFGASASKTYQEEYALGLKLFNERCKTAGKSVNAMVRDVQGLRLDNVPGELRSQDPGWLLAGMPGERLGDKFIASFLDFYFNDSDLDPSFGQSGMTVRMTGFHHVDVRQSDGSFRRYRLVSSDPYKGMTSEPVARSQVARYAVSIEPIGTTEERTHWVAGTRIVVTDTQTQRVIGESRSFSYALPPEVTGSDMNVRDWRNSSRCPKHLDVRDAMARTALNDIALPLFVSTPRPR